MRRKELMVVLLSTSVPLAFPHFYYRIAGREKGLCLDQSGPIQLLQGAVGANSKFAVTFVGMTMRTL